jgi:hypothetical protein
MPRPDLDAVTAFGVDGGRGAVLADRDDGAMVSFLLDGRGWLSWDPGEFLDTTAISREGFERRFADLLGPAGPLPLG